MGMFIHNQIQQCVHLSLSFRGLLLIKIHKMTLGSIFSMENLFFFNCEGERLVSERLFIAPIM